MGLGSEMTPADIAAVTRNNGGGFMGDGDSGWWLILLFLVFGGRGWGGGFGGGGGNCATPADIYQQGLITKLDGQTYGLADATFALNNTINQNFRGVDNAICNLGFNMSQGFNGIGRQLADCCCSIEMGIERNTTQGVMNTNAIQQQIAECCCANEKMMLQNKYDAAIMNNGTLQAIDKLGDRIIDYMNANEKAALRDENFALKLAASQAHQNQYLIDQIRPAPMPAFTVPAPYAFTGCAPTNYGCGCGC